MGEDRKSLKFAHLVTFLMAVVVISAFFSGEERSGAIDPEFFQDETVFVVSNINSQDFFNISLECSYCSELILEKNHWTKHF